MKNLLRKLFHKKPDPLMPRENARTFKVGGGWGDEIGFMDFQRGRVHGHKTPKPVTGDVLICAMQSGRTAVFLFASVDPCGDPPDMFFANVKAVDYLDELKWHLPVEQSGDPFGGYREKESIEAAYAVRNRNRR